MKRLVFFLSCVTAAGALAAYPNTAEPLPRLIPLVLDAALFGTTCSIAQVEIPPSISEATYFATAAVTVQLVAEPSGKVSASQVVRSSGYAALDNATLAAVRDVTCQYVDPPARPLLLEQTFEFDFQDSNNAASGPLCARMYSGRVVWEQSVGRPGTPIRVVHIPQDQSLCWRPKEFALVETSQDRVDDVIALATNAQTDVVVAALPQLSADSSDRSPARSRVTFYRRKDQPPVLTVWLSATPQQPGYVSYVPSAGVRSVYGLVREWTELEGRQLSWTAGAEGSIRDPARFSEVMDLPSVYTLEGAMERLNQALAKGGLIEGVNTPLEVCRTGRTVVVQPVKPEGCART